MVMTVTGHQHLSMSEPIKNNDMPNRVQRFFQWLMGIEPRPNLKGKVVIKSWRNQKNLHLLEMRDKVIFDTPKGTYIATYQGGDHNDVTNYNNIRILVNLE